MGRNYNPPSGENPYRVRNPPANTPKPMKPKDNPIDFALNRICPVCGKVIKINHNFCKFCGVDLSSIVPLGDSDRTLIELAKTALTDPNADVRRDAVDTIGDLGESEVLGILTYILLNDVDALVRKEAADELGNKHNPISIDILTKALKDRSPIVRKEAIEGLKKIKKMNKPKEQLEKRVEFEKKMEPEMEHKLISEIEESEDKEPEIEESEDNVPEIEESEDSEPEIEESEEPEEQPLKEIEPRDNDFYSL
ncbi:MAG: HEAT repeat domain-containing protein [Promethearchaeota archaeon]